MSERAPYFEFKEVENGEDAEQSAKLGYPVPKMTTFIFITPYGQRGGASEFVATEFIERKKREAKIGNYDPSWVKAFEEEYKAFKEGRTLPVDGTPLFTYERIAKTRREALSHQFPTVEALASVPDSSLNEIGLDGRVLRDLARGDVAAKKDLSPVVKELADAKETIRRQEEQLARLSSRLDLLESTPTKKSKAHAE